MEACPSPWWAPCRPACHQPGRSIVTVSFYILSIQNARESSSLVMEVSTCMFACCAFGSHNLNCSLSGPTENMADPGLTEQAGTSVRRTGPAGREGENEMPGEGWPGESRPLTPFPVSLR